MQRDIGMVRHLFLFITATILMQLAFVFLVQARSTLGFINIDCGTPKGQTSVDSETNITYVSDSSYIETGETYTVASRFLKIGTLKYLNTLRSFPDAIRNCYTIKPIVVGERYLLRAIFLFGKYDGKNKLPEFDLYYDIYFWSSVSFTNAADYSWYEIIVAATSDYISVCLADKGLGTPFISAIEVRPLGNNIYAQVNASQSLVLYRRVDFGGTHDLPLRYPYDDYDRYWPSHTPDLIAGNIGGCETLTTPNLVTPNGTNMYLPPSKVMQTAITPTSEYEMYISYTGLKLNEPSATDYYFMMHFAELKPPDETFRELYVEFNNYGDISGYIKLDYLKSFTSLASKPFVPGVLNFTLHDTDLSVRYTILNAMEIYTSLNMIALSPTQTKDVSAMMNIKDYYKVQKNWMGDPCAPKYFVWEGLKCSNNYGTPPRIISVNLKSNGLTGEITSAFANLTSLEYLDLSKNELAGDIPQFLEELKNLKYLNLSYNHLTGEIPRGLVARSKKGSLRLSVEGQVPKSSGGINMELAVGVAAAVFVLIAIILFFLWRRWKRKKDPQGQPENRGESTANDSSPRSESTQFTYGQLERITKKFSNKIGAGRFGVVYYGVLDKNIKVVVKMLHQSAAQDPERFINDARIVTEINEKNLLTPIGYCPDKKHLALVYEYMEGGNLQDYISDNVGHEHGKRKVLLWADRLSIAEEIAEGLEYLHKKHMIHGDVKPANIFLTQSLEAKVADFELLRNFESENAASPSNMVMGTHGYLDPRYDGINQLDDKSDVYSFGVLLLQIISGSPVYLNNNNTHISRWVFMVKEENRAELVDPNLEGQFDINIVKKIFDLALRCSATQSQERPTMTEVVQILKTFKGYWVVNPPA